MADNFLTIIRQLNDATLTRHYKEKFTNNLVDYSVKNGDKTMLQYMENIVDSIIRSHCRRNNIPLELIKYTIDYHSYKDYGEKIRGVLMVTILSDYRMEDNNIRDNIFNGVMLFLRSHNLDQFINDVSVNDKQWRRDRKISKLFTE